jgi:hypothetical protein
MLTGYVRVSSHSQMSSDLYISRKEEEELMVAVVLAL